MQPKVRDSKVHSACSYIRAIILNHTHEYKFWHAHMHLHDIEKIGHNHGHYHLFAQTHEHGKAGDSPHSHKERQHHPGDEAVEHHAKEVHQVEV